MPDTLRRQIVLSPKARHGSVQHLSVARYSRSVRAAAAASLVAWLFVGITGCSGVLSGLRWVTLSQPVRGAELRNLFGNEKPVTLSGPGDVAVTAVYAEDGTFTIRSSTGTASGVWHVQNDRFCMDTEDHSEKHCFTVYRSRGTETYSFFNEKGAFAARVTLL